MTTRNNRAHLVDMAVRREGRMKRASSDRNTDRDDGEKRPTQVRRSLRPRPHPRQTLDVSSDDDDATCEARFSMPTVGDVVSVCYEDENGYIENRDSDEPKVLWWSATVVGLLAVSSAERIKAVANLAFWPAHGKPRQQCSVFFLSTGLVIEVADYDSRPNNTSTWQFVSRATQNTTSAPAPNAGSPTPTTAQRRVARNNDGRHITSASRQARTTTAVPTPAGFPPPVPGDTHDLCERMSQVEAELKVLKNRQLTELELEVVKEIRVETKLGLVAALRRSHGPLHVREGASDVESAIQGGVIRWSYTCAMGRFKMLAAAAHGYFCEGTNQRPSSIDFHPSFEVLNSISGFCASEITFRTAMDLLRFLGIASTIDMGKLISFSYDAAGGRHLRVLGAMQDGWENGDPTLAMFIGHSCVRDSTWLPVADESKAVDAENVFFSNATWDSANSCFSSEATLKSSATGYKDIAPAECSLFKIRWETDPPRPQRTVGHVSVDTEGVRRGKMVVELPYYLLSPYLTTVFRELCNDEQLYSILDNMM